MSGRREKGASGGARSRSCCRIPINWRSLWSGEPKTAPNCRQSVH